MENIAKDLLKLKSAIDSAKAEQQKLSGQLEEKYKQLKTTFNVDTLEKAKALLIEKGSQLDSLEKEITDGYEQLKANYQW